MSPDQHAESVRDMIRVTVSWDVPEDWDDAKRDLRKRQMARAITHAARSWSSDALIDGSTDAG